MLSKLLPPINRIIHPKIIRQFSTNSFILKQKDIKDQFEENLNLNSKSIKKPNLFPGNSNSNLDIKSQVKSHINDDLKTIKKKNIQIPKEIKILYDLKESNNSISNSSESIDSNIESNSKLNILKEQIPTESTDIKAIFTEINQNETTNPSKPIINNQQSKPIKEPSTPLHDIITSPPSYSAPKKEISPHALLYIHWTKPLIRVLGISFGTYYLLLAFWQFLENTDDETIEIERLKKLKNKSIVEK